MLSSFLKLFWNPFVWKNLRRKSFPRVFQYFVVWNDVGPQPPSKVLWHLILWNVFLTIVTKFINESIIIAPLGAIKLYLKSPTKIEKFLFLNNMQIIIIFPSPEKFFSFATIFFQFKFSIQNVNFPLGGNKIPPFSTQTWLVKTRKKYFSAINSRLTKFYCFL